MLQPLQVKAFGRIHLRRAKNDVLDAVLIAAALQRSIHRRSRQIRD